MAGHVPKLPACAEKHRIAEERQQTAPEIAEVRVTRETDHPAFRRTVFNIAAVNQDDHVKNFAFLMDETGAWRLAPAYDLTYARGLGFSRAHQMTLGGKTGRFVREDLLALGKTMGLRKDGAAILTEVTGALREWERFSHGAGLHANRVRFIASEFRLL